MFRLLPLFLFLLLPSQVLSQAIDGSQRALVFRDGSISVHELGDELQVSWEDNTRIIQRRTGALEIRRVQLDEQTEALDLWGGEARYPLLMLREGEIVQVWIRAVELAELRNPRRSFPGDGTVRIMDTVSRPCHPRRRDLIRSRQGSSGRSLRQIDQQASSWTQHRAREFVLRVEGHSLVAASPNARFRYPGGWGACDSGPRVDPSGERDTEQGDAFEGEGERVYQDTALGVEIAQHLDAEGQTLRVRWRGQTGFVRTAQRWPAEQTTVREVTVGRGVVGLLVSGSWSAGEDWSYYQNFLWMSDEQGLHPVQDSDSTHFVAGYDATVRFPGDGTARIMRHATRECRPNQAAMRRWQQYTSPELSVAEASRLADSWVQTRTVERILDIEDHRFVHAVPRWRRASSWGRCEGWLFAACPFVDVLGPSGSTRIGEILRSTEYAPATQSLALPSVVVPASGEPLLIRISEEKAEVTFLDEIHVEVDGVYIRPDVCTEMLSPPTFCEADGRYSVLANGDELVLSFTLPATSSAPEIEVVASGYYEPEPSEPGNSEADR